ncbi:hypothetical protein [Streptococcus mutans]|nr:hypothetical protein [Streptococcus mutans]EMC07397.1 hypothetical protein SMU72_08383 [Streptococcus mutans NLML9]EMC55892.1 hypothetical protein SMU108_07991 [Streptococcus mutans M230]
MKRILESMEKHNTKDKGFIYKKYVPLIKVSQDFTKTMVTIK